MRLDRHYDMQTFAAGGFYEALQTMVGKQHSELLCGRRDLIPEDAGTGIEIEYEAVRPVQVARPPPQRWISNTPICTSAKRPARSRTAKYSATASPSRTITLANADEVLPVRCF